MAATPEPTAKPTAHFAAYAVRRPFTASQVVRPAPDRRSVETGPVPNTRTKKHRAGICVASGVHAIVSATVAELTALCPRRSSRTVIPVSRLRTATTPSKIHVERSSARCRHSYRHALRNASVGLTATGAFSTTDVTRS